MHIPACNEPAGAQGVRAGPRRLAYRAPRFSRSARKTPRPTTAAPATARRHLGASPGHVRPVHSPANRCQPPWRGCPASWRTLRRVRPAQPLAPRSPAPTRRVRSGARLRGGPPHDGRRYGPICASAWWGPPPTGWRAPTRPPQPAPWALAACRGWLAGPGRPPAGGRPLGERRGHPPPCRPQIQPAGCPPCASSWPHRLTIHCLHSLIARRPPTGALRPWPACAYSRAPPATRGPPLRQAPAPAAAARDGASMAAIARPCSSGPGCRARPVSATAAAA